MATTPAVMLAVQIRILRRRLRCGGGPGGGVPPGGSDGLTGGAGSAGAAEATVSAGDADPAGDADSARDADSAGDPDSAGEPDWAGDPESAGDSDPAGDADPAEVAGVASASRAPPSCAGGSPAEAIPRPGSSSGATGLPMYHSTRSPTSAKITMPRPRSNTPQRE